MAKLLSSIILFNPHSKRPVLSTIILPMRKMKPSVV